MSLHKHALIRYRIIDNMLRNPYRKFPTIDEIQRKCEESLFGSDYGDHICKSTIEKDLRAMRSDMELGFFAPIKFSRRNLGYYYDDSEYTIQKIPLKPNDIEALKFAANTLFNFRESDVFSEFKFAIEKIFNRLNISNEVQDNRIKNVVKFDSYPDYPGSEHLPLIYDAIVNQQKLQLTYQKFNSTQKTERIIHPYLLKEHRYRWYVIGFSEERSRVITFALDRIVEINNTDANFEIESQFNPSLFFKDAFGITQTDDEVCEIVLHFSKSLEGYLKTQPLHQSQKMEIFDDYIEIVITVIPGFELFEKILSYGSQVEVVSPINVREKVAELLKSALLKYN